uniref:Uncharacterized protein n=1 Tax=Chromera velia CCMP2878 TaxID=1169474 RepID=A0A0G4GGX8_9ALVE|eukprot:Cvel_4691.t1-p1 / transcript=Cvel_4691.t1 / gene=Cvel_4691 / organism=Chromera_velia_CCMP2878 / gene_product=hypothetical protein / transcript_product=hypothetical protein / location=Cvel_scaffold208:83248-85258(+) / protein_length=250 / sequence_SO=supercontig / SO=protein_coding / is_pseudo=false
MLKPEGGRKVAPGRGGKGRGDVGNQLTTSLLRSSSLGATGGEADLDSCRESGVKGVSWQVHSGQILESVTQAQTRPKALTQRRKQEVGGVLLKKRPRSETETDEEQKEEEEGNFRETREGSKKVKGPKRKTETESSGSSAGVRRVDKEGRPGGGRNKQTLKAKKIAAEEWQEMVQFHQRLAARREGPLIKQRLCSGGDKQDSARARKRRHLQENAEKGTENDDQAETQGSNVAWCMLSERDAGLPKAFLH